MARSRPVTRRRFLGTVLTLSGLSAALPLLQACSAAAPAPTQAPAAPAKAPPSTPAPAAVAPTPAPAAAPTQAPAAVAPTVAAKTAATPASAAKIKRGGKLVVHKQNNWETLDFMTSQSSAAEAPLAAEALVVYRRNPQSGTFEVKPGLAESWEIADPTTIVFRLRRGVKFHDGSDFNAEVARWNLNRLRTHPKTFGKEHTESIAEESVVDDYTLKLKLKYPDAAILAKLTDDADRKPLMMSKAHWDKVGDDGVKEKVVGTGPFEMVKWVKGDSGTFKKFDKYWDKGEDGQALPYVDEITVRFIQDWTTALMDVRAGGLHFVQEISGRDVGVLKSDPNLVLKEVPWQVQMYALGFNARAGAKFAGDKMRPVRKAAFHAINREAIAKALGQGIGFASHEHLVPGQLGYNENAPKHQYDPDLSRKLMKEAGLDKIDAVVAMVSRPEDIQNVQLYQEMLAQVGINITIEPQERVAWAQRMLAGNYDITAFRSGARVDPDLVLGFRYLTGGGGNYNDWKSETMDKCLQEGRANYDPTQRQKIYERCEGLVVEDAYYDWIWHRRIVRVVNKKLQGWIDSWDYPKMTTWWLDA